MTQYATTPPSPANTKSLLPPFIVISLLGACFLAITMGLRQTVGLYVPSLQMRGFSIATISLALAIGQLVWGLVQPIAGLVADRFGHLWVLIIGVLILMIGNLLVPYCFSPFGLIMTFGLLASLGSGIGSFSTLIGLTSGSVPIKKRSLATGIINAGGSFGQFAYAPLIQSWITRFDGFRAITIGAYSALLAIPCALLMHYLAGKQVKAAQQIEATADRAGTAQANHPPEKSESFSTIFKQACRHRDYALLHLGFFTCGFHVAFLVTHLKVEVVTCHGLSEQVAAYSLATIGLLNIFGSLLAGYLGEHMRLKNLLAVIYGCRVVAIVIYLLAPKSAWTFYLFAGALGMTWLATVPPTAGLVARFFGIRYLATLFGLTLVSHQLGGFFGAYLGGITMQYSGNYNYMWAADIILAAFAVLVSWLIREQPAQQ